MNTNEKIDRVFVEGGNLTLIVGHGQDEKRLLVTTSRLTEASPILGRAINDPTDHDSHHPRIKVGKPKEDHTQLSLLADNPDAWMLLCAILYPQSGWSAREVGGEPKLDAARYAVMYEMKAVIRNQWPRFVAAMTLSWPDMWISMNACFFLEMPKEFEVLSREIIYGYKGPFEDLSPLSHNAEWGVTVSGKC